jgi:Ca-activated chloride channel family protein
MQSLWFYLLSLILLFPVLPLRAQEPSSAPPQPIRLTVERVNIGVIVTDVRGKFVEGLRREDFRVFDDGAGQPITEFAPVDDPAQVLLFVEAGPAVYFLQDVHLYTASALLEGLSPGDRVAVARYTEAPLALLNFTADKRDAQNALGGISYDLGFGQLNLSASLNAILDWLDRVPGKKTIVLLSTGVDTSSNAMIDLLQARLQTGDVRILCVSLSAPLRNGKEGGHAQVQQAQRGFADADARLQAIADATGGRVFFPDNAKAFQETYRQIAELVRHEYSLAFQPPAADGAVHQIKVTVNLVDESNKGKPLEYRVDHRRAYRAPNPSPAR